ncbi:MAG: PQQ-binding-like beta-propeller repeat protein [Dehalococcoidia bacterium]|nr:PQQ-binding-like beta-propeller repeat protein [Dehalococcoidia bacterium]
MLYVGSWDGCLHAVNAVDGKQRWKYQTEGQIYSSPAASESTIYFGSGDGYIYAIAK